MTDASRGVALDELTATLADSWPVLCPALPSAWDTAANRNSLAAMSRRLAPVPRIALECRLGEKAPAIDVQQCIRRDNDEPLILRDFIMATQIMATQPASAAEPGVWQRLADFCTAWADPDSLLHRHIGEIFLEFDLDSGDPDTLHPSIFFSTGERESPSAATESVRAALDVLLGKPFPEALMSNIERCIAACPDGANVSYVGAMLGRAPLAARINVRGLALCDVQNYLLDVGWDGPLTTAQKWAEWAFDRVDRVILCLDVGEVVYPRIGLECVIDGQPNDDPRWQSSLAEFGSSGECARENIDAFLSIPGALSPQTARAWPVPMIIESLLSPADQFSTTERRLSHFKLTITGEGLLVKGYWGAGHVWQSANPNDRAALTATDVQLSSTAVERALDNAVGFLADRQAHTGRWNDFDLPAGPSDEWVTAFVACCMLETSSTAAYSAAERALAALEARERAEAGWGYNRLTPSDADSTAWVLRLASRLEAGASRFRDAQTFLRAHLRPDGGCTTYAAIDPIQRYARLPSGASFAGWQSAHPCVSAAAAPLLGTPVEGYLASAQLPAGNWESYWWPDDAYTTALAVEALASNATAVNRAVTWALASMESSLGDSGNDVSPWQLAWLTRILRHGTDRAAQEARTRVVSRLLAIQKGDGSWCASAHMRVPMPGDVDAAGSRNALQALDRNSVFTTAAVTAALAMIND